MTKISEKGLEKAWAALPTRHRGMIPLEAAIAAYLDAVAQDAKKGGDVFARPVTDARVDIGAGVSANTTGAVAPASDRRYSHALADATARAKGENMDGSPRRECSLAEVGIPASDPAPVGWRMVPVEPTETLIELLAKAYDRVSFDPEEDGLLDVAQPVRDRARYDARLLYPLLLAAAPEPPVSAEPTQQQLDAAWARVAPLVGCDPTSAADPVPSGWRDISTAPKRDRKKRTDVLLGSFPKGAIAVGEAHRPPRDCFTTMDGTYHAPTHWQPLPAAPKGKGSE